MLLNYNPVHIQKLMFHKLSLDGFETELTSAGYRVIRVQLADYPTTADALAYISDQGVTAAHVADTTDNYLEQTLADAAFTRVRYPSPIFILDTPDATERYMASKRYMASFYKQLRKDQDVLIDSDGKPVGGKWSFDEVNRQKIPKDTPLPGDLTPQSDTTIAAAAAWAKALPGEQYGTADYYWLPYTRDAALAYLDTFLAERFSDFGTYEDAITERGVRLWHSTLSPLINVGLLHPQEVLEAALNYAEEHDIAINNLEGFVRQILGWREFIRASYESDGRTMRTSNFFNHTHQLPDSFWTGEIASVPLASSIKTALRFGYNHHIERLMVLGNFMLLSQTNPHEVYRWFMGMYVDAYDWVMVPNVYGMSQFADGGSFATKPYISGANYLRKMSDYPKGDWESLWTALYWNFIHEHQDFFLSNHRTAMLPRLLERMTPETKATHLAIAADYLKNLS